MPFAEYYEASSLKPAVNELVQNKSAFFFVEDEIFNIIN